MLPDDLTTAERANLGIEAGGGILLLEVYEGGPAAFAGLRKGDVILEMNGEPVYSQRQALLISASTTPGETVEITGLRNGQRFTARVVAGERPDEPR